jgi:hypothetical protein
VQAGKDAAQLFALFTLPGFVDKRLDPRAEPEEERPPAWPPVTPQSGVNDKRAEPRHPLRRTDPSRATGGKKRRETKFTAPAYWKFESTSLQR